MHIPGTCTRIVAGTVLYIVLTLVVGHSIAVPFVAHESLCCELRYSREEGACVASFAPIPIMNESGTKVAALLHCYPCVF